MTEAIKKNGVTFGIIMAAYMVLRGTIMYAVDLNLFTSGWIKLIDFIVTVAISVIAVFKAKSAQGGFISFKDAFVVYFINNLIGLVAYCIFIIVLFNVIDPAAKEIVNEYTIKSSIEGMQKFGVDSKTLRETAVNMRKSNVYSTGNQLMGLPISIAISCIVGLIIAAIMKKNKPEFQ
jgi:fumarate reductase subunit C